MSTQHAAIPPLQAIFDAATHFGLTDDEVWQAVNECFCDSDGDATIGDCVDELVVALAQRILQASTASPRRRRPLG